MGRVGLSGAGRWRRDASRGWLSGRDAGPDISQSLGHADSDEAYDAAAEARVGRRRRDPETETVGTAGRGTAHAG